MENQIIHVKHMLCSSCIKLVQMELNGLGFSDYKVQIGRVAINQAISKKDLANIQGALERNGFAIVQNQEEVLVDKIKKTVVDLVFHMNNMNSIVQKSEYLVEMLDLNYEKIAREFRKHEPITLEKYIILVKIERIKEMLESDAYTLSEIAYMMDYSSVQYLSSQFKKVTGVTVSDYKEHKMVRRIPLDQLTSTKN